MPSRYILELNKSQGIHDLGEIKWDMALCLLAVYLICYFSLWKGISTSGKVCIFTCQIFLWVQGEHEVQKRISPLARSQHANTIIAQK